MDNSSSEFKRIVWRTAIAGRIERFKAVLNSSEKQKYFDSAFTIQLTTKIDRLFRTLLVLSAIYTAIMLSLLTSQDPTKSEFQILGYSFKNLGYYKEFLLFASALIAPLSSIVAAYHRYLTELRKANLQKMYPDTDVLDYATHLYADMFFDPLVKDPKLSSRIPHTLTTVLVSVFAIGFIFFIVTLILASFVLQLSVIYDVATKPASNLLLNRFIVAFALAAIALSWLVGVLQLPLPEVDADFYSQLNQLKESDSAKYKEVMTRIAHDSARKETIWHVAASCILFFLIYYTVAALAPLYPANVWAIFFKAIPGAAIAIFVSISATKLIKRKVYGSYFRTFPEGADEGLKHYATATQKIRRLRTTIVIFASLIYSVTVLQIA